MEKRDLLFLDQSAEPGGAELCMLSIAHHLRSICRVGVFSDGPFRQMLVAADIENTAIDVPDAVLNVRRDADWSDMVRAVPGCAMAVFRIVALARKAKLVYANTQKAFVIGAFAAFVARRPIVWHLHDILDKEHFSGGTRSLVIKLANKFATKIIANSHATLHSFVAAGGDPSRAVVIWNGIDIDRFNSASGSELALARASFGAGKSPLIGIFGRLAPWKGQHVLLEALPTLPQVHAVIVGAPLYGEDAYADQLYRLVQNLGLTGRVHFLGFRHDIPSLMQVVDIILHTSIAPEPFGRVIVEGMLAGKPVIATRGGATDEIIDDGVDGILVPAGDSDALANAIRSVLDSRSLRETMINAAIEKARARFSLKAMLAAIDQVIEDVCATELASTTPTPSPRPTE